MKIGIIGLPQVGKKTLFEILTGQNLSDEGYSSGQDIKQGSALVRDNRFDRLVDMYKPAKESPAKIDVVLLPKFDKETVSSGEFAKSLEKCDALCHIVRAFEDESVFHEEGSVDALRDIENVFTELILRDLMLVEKRIENIDLDTKKGVASNIQVKEKEILLLMKDLLDKNLPLTNLDISDEDKKIMSTYNFMTRKTVLVVLNVADDKLSDQSLIKNVEEKYSDYNVKVMQISAKIEAELALLETQEREEFLKDLNIEESALNRLSSLYFDALGLISFFTVGETEVHQWTTRKGSSAPKAAGSIHSDMERGFIRAEIFKCNDLFELGGEPELKEAGKWMLKGKDYIVEDGDIMFIRFNV
ncbi:MAG: redox-regulated ATPase YchF [Candidatus Zapsychrus exili]|nr:redox-regulated ATPase YchF [Candidatus Zapsychrus exili]